MEKKIEVPERVIGMHKHFISNVINSQTDISCILQSEFFVEDKKVTITLGVSRDVGNTQDNTEQTKDSI